MQLPNGHLAVVDDIKLTGYCLNPGHPIGKHKARQFFSRLGLETGDWRVLRQALLAAAAANEAIEGDIDGFGRRYVVDFLMETWKDEARIRSAWIVRAGESFPRFVTCFVMRDGEEQWMTG